MPGAVLGVLVGRDGAVARLRGLVAETAGGRGGSVWVEGEPGIGKSALLVTGLSDAGRLGCVVLWAGADDVGGRFPLRVLLDCLRSGQLAADMAYRQVAAMLRDDGGGAAATTDAAAMAAELLLDSIERLCVTSPVVLAADDLQWADELSLSVWRRLHGLVGQLPLLLVSACRPVPAIPQLAALRRELAEEAVVVRLEPLEPAHVREMVAGLVGAPPGPRLMAHATRAAGNPLYLRELIDALTREQSLRVMDGVADVVDTAETTPRSLSAAISGRLGFLSKDALQLLRVAALFGGEFSVNELTIVTGRPATVLAIVLDEAIAAGVVTEGAAGLVFRHGLIRQSLCEATPASLRSALHRQAAQALAAAGVPVERVAGQLLAAPDAVDGWVVGWVADVALPLTYRAPQVAVDLLTRVRHAVRAGDPLRERVDAGLATALFMLARYDQVEPLAGPVLATTSDPEVVGRMTWTLAHALQRMVRHEAALEVLDTALRDAALTEVWNARVQALRALVLVGCGRPGDAETAAARAEADGVRAGDELAVGYALHALSIVQGRHGRYQAALEAIERALASIGQKPETVDVRLGLLGNRMSALSNVGRMVEMERAAGEGLAVAEQAGPSPSLVTMRLHAADCWYVTGRWDDALAELAAAADLPKSSALRFWLHGLGALIASHRDDRAATHEHMHAVEDLDARTGEHHYHSRFLFAARAVEAERDGKPERALGFVLSAVDMIYPGTSGDEDMGEIWLPDAVRLALTVGDIDVARSLTDAAAAPGITDRLTFRMAVAKHCRGLLASDPALVLAAAEDFSSIRDPLNRAQALENAAVLLAQECHMPAARSAYGDALDVYTELEAAWDIRRADTRLRALGLNRGARGPRRRPATGWDALTPSELAIAKLVAAGRSNPDIAAELFLSRRTVQTHVSHILAKLGAQSRVGIARVALSHNESDAA